MGILERRLAAVLSRNWWVLLIRGLVAIAFALFVWFRPGISLASLVLVFGAFVLVDGVLGVGTAFAGRREHEDWWMLLLWGLVGIGVGTLTVVAPGVTALALLFYIAIWAIGTGIMQIAAAIRLRKEIENEWLLILAGLASVLFGVVLISRPAAGALALLWMVGVYAFLFGILMVMLGLRLKSLGAAAARP